MPFQGSSSPLPGGARGGESGRDGGEIRRFEGDRNDVAGQIVGDHVHVDEDAGRGVEEVGLDFDGVLEVDGDLVLGAGFFVESAEGGAVKGGLGADGGEVGFEENEMFEDAFPGIVGDGGIDEDRDQLAFELTARALAASRAFFVPPARVPAVENKRTQPRDTPALEIIYPV